VNLGAICGQNKVIANVSIPTQIRVRRGSKITEVISHLTARARNEENKS